MIMVSHNIVLIQSQIMHQFLNSVIFRFLVLTEIMHFLPLNQNLIIRPPIIDHLVNVVFCPRWKTWDAVIISY